MRNGGELAVSSLAELRRETWVQTPQAIGELLALRFASYKPRAEELFAPPPHSPSPSRRLCHK